MFLDCGNGRTRTTGRRIWERRSWIHSAEEDSSTTSTSSQHSTVSLSKPMLGLICFWHIVLLKSIYILFFFKLTTTDLLCPLLLIEMLIYRLSRKCGPIYKKKSKSVFVAFMQTLFI